MKNFIKAIKKITLKEVLLFLTLIIIIFVIILPLCIRHQSKEYTMQAKLQLSLLEQGVASFKNDTGTFPNTIDELLLNKRYLKNWNGPYIKEESLTDPWGNKFYFKVHDDLKDYDIVCLGPDNNLADNPLTEDIKNRP